MAMSSIAPEELSIAGISVGWLHPTSISRPASSRDMAVIFIWELLKGLWHLQFLTDRYLQFTGPKLKRDKNGINSR